MTISSGANGRNSPHMARTLLLCQGNLNAGMREFLWILQSGLKSRKGQPTLLGYFCKYIGVSAELHPYLNTTVCPICFFPPWSTMTILASKASPVFTRGGAT